MSTKRLYVRKQFITRFYPERVLDKSFIEFLNQSKEQGKSDTAVLLELFSAYLLVKAAESGEAHYVRQLISSSNSSNALEASCVESAVSVEQVKDDTVLDAISSSNSEMPENPMDISSVISNVNPGYAEDDELSELSSGDLDLTFEDLGINTGF